MPSNMASNPPQSSSSRRSKMGDTTVGSFRIEDEIGKGAFATVYRGVERHSAALVAIKSVNLSKLNKKLKENLYSEIDILKGLHHPHIVGLIDCRESSTHIHLVMEYCQLGDLSFFIKKRDKLISNPATADMARKYPNPVAGGLNEVITRHFLKQIASALESLRARNLIHRDVKPQNLLLSPSAQYMASTPDAPKIMSSSDANVNFPSVGVDSLPVLKIADFGFARSLPSTSLAETLCGSPLYMAPEILRYEKYDAKADLWSVGTVLFEMMTGRPPFRASNHVELLRKIEQGDDVIRFSKESVVSSGMRSLIRGLLKRNPVERMSFESFFSHDVVKETIPGLVSEDRPDDLRRRLSKTEGSQPMSRQPSNPIARRATTERGARVVDDASSLRHRVQEDPQAVAVEPGSPRIRQLAGTPPTRPKGERMHSVPSSYSNQETQRPRRPTIPPSSTAPSHVPLREGLNTAQRQNIGRRGSQESPSPGSSLFNEQALKDKKQPTKDAHLQQDEAARAAMDVAFERDYVLVEKRAVEVNAFADEMAANPRLSGAAQVQAQAARPKSGHQGTTKSAAPSTIGASPATVTRAVQIAPGRPRPNHQRQHSSDGQGGSPRSATSAISKAIQGASLRLFGIGYAPPLGRKGQSPPQFYSPFPAYPASAGISGLIGDGKLATPTDEDAKAVHIIEESATVSDVVYGFAEVKYKQLIPTTPSMDHGLGGPAAPGEGHSGMSVHDGCGLTPDATVTLAEEALVLYVKALALLAKSMDIAGAWWAKNNRGEVIGSGNSPRSESASNIVTGNRINGAVQWVRGRFNEVLEKAEFVRLKLLEAQKQLPEDHPAHPCNHTSTSRLAGGTSASADGVILSTGATAEKLMYDRALEMSRSAAINEIANVDLPGCDLSYVTAIRMLEAVLENDDIGLQKKGNTVKEEKENQTDDASINGINLDDRQAVQKVISMIRGRLHALRKKMALIAKHQSLPYNSSRPPSDHSGGTTPKVTSTPPK